MSALFKAVRVFAVLGTKLARKLGSDLKCTILERGFRVFQRQAMSSPSHPGLGVFLGVRLLGPDATRRVIRVRGHHLLERQPLDRFLFLLSRVLLL